MTRQEFIEKMNGVWFDLEDKRSYGLCEAFNYNLSTAAAHYFKRIFGPDAEFSTGYWLEDHGLPFEEYANDVRFFVYNYFKTICLEDKLYLEW